MKWANLRSDTRKLVGLIAIFVVLSAIQPLLWQVVQWQALIVQDKRSVSQQIENVTERTEMLQSSIESQRIVLAQLGTIAPPSGELTTIVERLEHVASKHGLQIQLRDISNEEPVRVGESETGILSSVIVSATVVGSVDSILTYLEELEHMPEMLVITSWFARPSSVAPSSPSLNLEEPDIDRTQATANYEMVFEVQFFLQRDVSSTLNSLR